MAEEQGLNGADQARRFGGVGRLYGEAAAQRFAAAKVCVVGIGGVGSWVAEALARSAVGQLTLIDLDMVAESNANRQIHALDPVWGMAKVEAMRARILAINPACEVRCVEDFVTPENLAELLGGHDLIVDAIDQTRVKVAMAAWCVAQGVPLVMAGGAGGKQDPSLICSADLSRTEQDPLLARVRAQLRKEHGFPKDPKRKFGITAIYSSEPLQRPVVCESGEPVDAPQGLSCAGYGSAVCVTAPFGFFAAAAALRLLS
ncbi:MULTISPECIES: ThiF family adenylyltransferase [unclassified Uliginosibacterium]|jgi:tRNA A37 threonylcarbamoyladenosine dehydratase|uniref:tRNA threonylcarbamoyladenosine dehydratase n=1 Tax=unclassified Uliginosibacterium TaxID=2621521 RepID=UPI000C7B4DDF|nr:MULTISPECIES: tRNA threonylcarbamoyladenosine dehydratase [unclassified Uliginosibacterium]MDO6387590.1 tRNA threonylcarbamoyladenosine dehydratase [Uliginosibacterium sp. 31-12]PLK47912.1 tRNA cyclic N6-threonylcarbamoyladenosine(37) synthase TcdA [Uliginosibacterium sp. TH139]